MSSKKTSKSITTEAAKTLNNHNASKIQQQLAGSALSQADSTKSTSGRVETIASKALASSKYSETTKALAGSVLSQSIKKR